MVDFSQQAYKTMLFAALGDMAAIAEQLGIQEMKEPGQIISAVREMQKTEQRLRAEIARLQAIADRAVPYEPTDKMIEAGYAVLRKIHAGPFGGSPSIGHARHVYITMLAAAPQPQDSTP